MRKMLILLAAASLAIAGACGGDDDDSASGGSNGGYTDAVEEAFMSNCVPAAEGAADPTGMCQCAYDNIAATVPFEEFAAFDEAVRDDPSAQPPAAIATATTDCATGTATTAAP